MSEPPIVIRRHHCEGTGKHGYRWTCRLCGARGLHRFDRWTDWVRHRNPDPHPWVRAMDGAREHLRRRHGIPPTPAVHVHLHIGGLT